MRRLKKYSLLALFLLCAWTAGAQYYSWGASPASVRWRKIKTGDVKLIYPSEFEYNARRALWYLDTIRPHIDFGFRHGTMHSPVVLHTQNTMGNGMVMWAPKRIELLAAPGASYSEPWLKQLVIHEYRHNVQYNNLRRSTNRVLTWLLGEQIAFLGVGQFSIFILEGDATMAETEMSAFGRGKQPSWSMHYRAVGGKLFGRGANSDGVDWPHRRDRQRERVGSSSYAGDYWFSGSYRDFVPDHYRLGYQLARWSYEYYDKFIWDDLAYYVARNPQWLLPMVFGLDKLYDTGTTKLLRDGFSNLYSHWDAMPEAVESTERIETPETSYTTYQWPLWFDENTLIAFKEDFDRTSRIVRVDVATGREEVLAYTGIVSSRPVLENGVLLWTEFRSSLLWEQKVNSRLCSYDMASGRKRIHDLGGEQIFYPTHVAYGEAMAYATYDYSGRFTIVMKDYWSDKKRFDLPADVEVTGLAWDNATQGLYFIGLDDGGMFLGEVAEEGYRRLTPSRHITISDLRAEGGKLYFGSIVSGKDEAHRYDILTGTEYRVSESAYGSFQPSPSPDGGRAALTTYDRHGYHLAVQSTADAVRQEQRALPVDLVNPPWRGWDLPRMDSLVYTPTEAEHSCATLKTHRHSKFLNVFHPHSWLPIGFYPPAAIQEADLTMNLGATVMSQSLLSDAVSWLSYGWGRRGGSMLRGGLSYSGLGAVLDVDFTWGGGSQALYTPIPENVALKRYFSVATRLSLPMNLSSGYWQSALSPSAEWFYTNGLIFRPIAGQPRGVLTRGVERLTFGVAYSGQTRLAHKEFLPRWGVGVRANFAMNPTNSDFRNVVSLSVRGNLPGVVRPHGTTLRVAWQESVGRPDAPFLFRMKEVFPRGASYDFAARRWASGSLDYQFPVWYPEGGIPKWVYFKRVRVNLFADYARWQEFGAGGRGIGGAWRPLFSYGGDLILDINPIRTPAASTMAVRFTFAKPSDRKGIFFNFGLELPL